MDGIVRGIVKLVRGLPDGALVFLALLFVGLLLLAIAGC